MKPSAIFVLSMLAAAQCGFSQSLPGPRRECPVVIRTLQISTHAELSWSITPINMSLASSQIGTGAAAVAVPTILGSMCCPVGEKNPAVAPESAVNAGQFEATATLLDRLCSEPTPTQTRAHALVSAAALMGSWETDTIFGSQVSHYNGSGCDHYVYYNTLALAGITCDVADTFTRGEAPAGIQVTINFEADVHFDTCEEGMGAPAVGSIDPVVTVEDVVLTGTDGTNTEQFLVRGVLAVDDDGVETRLGFYSGSEFGMNGDVFSGSKMFSLSFSFAPTSVSIVPARYGFNTFDGDLNADQAVCWTDRRIMVSLIGLDIDDAGYNARADFDLDGDIDQNDYDAFVSVFDSTVTCHVDYDCSGSVDSTDYFQFTNDFLNNDPVSDYNGDGVVNSQDWNDFLSDFFAGC